MNPAMTLRDVSAFYDGKPAIEHISADIPKNRITAVIGPSGCGKSTLLRCMNGLLAQEPGTEVRGAIALDGTDISRLPSEELRRRVGLVFQTPTPFPFSILKNLTFAPQYYGQRDKRALEALAVEKLRLCGLYDEVKDDLRKNAQKLSGGQQQRLCIARALTVEPDILLLDEPCSALDVRATQTVEELLLRLKERYTVVVVTHNLAQARRIADTAMFLYNGHLIEQGEHLLTDPQEKETRAFLDGAFG